MNTPPMTFDESYGELPTPLMRLIRKYNVSPADYNFMVEFLFPYPKSEEDLWFALTKHIVLHSGQGMYNYYPGEVG